MPVEVGRLGAWVPKAKLTPDLGRELEALGYGAVWIGTSPGGDLRLAEDVLDATDRLAVATGIVNIWADQPDSIAAAYHRITERFRGRFLLGVGAGHPEVTGEYRKPYAALVEYLDALDAAGVPKDERALAALGPKVLRLAADRTAGAHPYLVTPEHTRDARALLGQGVLLAPEQKVVVDADPQRARALGRPVVEHPYLGLSNYVANLRQLGFGDADFADGGSDRLIDALVAHGSPEAVAVRLQQHFDAGADHVAVQLITAPDGDPVAGFRALASEVL